MNNLEVLQQFANREEGKTQKRNIMYSPYYQAEGRTLQSVRKDNKIYLINYNTILAITDGFTFTLNDTYYSKTTSKIFHKLGSLLNDKQCNILYDKTLDNIEVSEVITSE